MALNYIKGDVTAPIGTGPRVITHCCNNVGAFGAGVAWAIAKRWPKVRDQYLAWYQRNKDFELGQVQFVPVANDLWVANLIGQEGIGLQNGPPIRYAAIKRGLERVAEFTLKVNGSVHMPRIGCALAGGRWAQMEPIIQETLCLKGLDVTVYDFGVGGYNP